MLIAHHLPQFHAIPENDEWWGKGFTDWVKVRNAKPLFAGHEQPRVPHPSLGEYDLSRIESLLIQWDLARRHGIDGFCYYHYWFDGKRLLQRPVELARAWNGPEKLPYCLCWANEPWTRVWDGFDRQVLMPQSYGSEASWEAHFLYLEPFFADTRYIRWHGCPLFLLYRAASIPAAEQMIACWQALARRRPGTDLAVVQMRTSFGWDTSRSSAYDATLCFEPMLSLWPETRAEKMADLAIRPRACGLRRGPHFFSFDRCWRKILSRRYGPHDWPGAFVGWDNTPRRGADGHVCLGGSPAKFGDGMRKLTTIAKANSVPFVFVNAWNEWAEGNYLEPDTILAYSYLKQLSSAK